MRKKKSPAPDAPPDGVRRPRSSRLARFEESLKTVLGPAQVSPLGAQPARSGDRLAGAGARYEIHRDGSGVPYVVARTDEAPPRR